ncbi:Hypothetical protein GLP15_2439 [Giardia lamblia P15]|uniref:Uncharacterized protein n=1 Tax=Giardia intestinalis (strain P15) TaxID=658858 RepID=E1F6T3_GIAIA|nr:Hypothetical protein GLP15_2439 [Giardia lamblia P15]
MNIFFSAVPDPNRNYDNKFERLNGKPNDRRLIIAYQRANSSTTLPEQNKSQICHTYFYLILDLFRYAPYGIEEILKYLIPRLQVIPISARKLSVTLRKSSMEEDASIISAHTMALFSFYCLMMPFSIHVYTKHLLSQATKGNALAIEFPFYDKLFIEVLKHASGEASNFGWEFHLLCYFTNAVVPSKKCKRKTLVEPNIQQMYTAIEQMIKDNSLEQCLSFIKNNLLTSINFSKMQKALTWNDCLRHLFASSACLLLGILRYRILEKVFQAPENNGSVLLTDLADALFIKGRRHTRLVYLLRSMEEILETHKKSVKFISKCNETWHAHRTIVDRCSKDENAKKKLSFLLIAVDLCDNYTSVLPMADWGANGAERELITTCIEVLFQKDSPWQILYPYASCQLPRNVSWKPILPQELGSIELSDVSQNIHVLSTILTDPARPSTRPPSPIAQIASQPSEVFSTAFKTPKTVAQPMLNSQEGLSSPPSAPSSPTISDLDYERTSLNLLGDTDSQSDIDWSYYTVKNTAAPHFKFRGQRIYKRQSLIACAVNQHVISRYAQAYYDAGFLLVNRHLQRRAFRAWFEALAVRDCNRLVAKFAQEIFETGQFYTDKWTRHKNLLDLRLNQFIQHLAFYCWIDCYQDRLRLKEVDRRSSYEQKIQTW